MQRPSAIAVCLLALLPCASAQTRTTPVKQTGRPHAGAARAPIAPLGSGSALVGGSDSCATPEAIVGDGLYPFDTGSATTGPQGQTQAICNQVGGGSAIFSDVWFAWTATADGLVSVDTCGLTSVDTKIAVYAGAGCPAAPALACNDDACSGAQSTATFNAQAGQSYTIQLGLYPGAQPPATPGPGQFRISTTPVQAGQDSCSTALALSGDGIHAFDLSSATTGAEGQSEILCNIGGSGTAILQDIWYRWTATSTGTVVVNTCGLAQADTKLALYAGPGCPGAAALACNDDACAGLQSTLTAPVVAGQVYMLQLGLGPANAPSTGPFTGQLGIQTRQPPANDACSAPQNLAGLALAFYDCTAATTGAQGQDEPLCNEPAGTAIVKDLWYAWTAPSTGRYSVASCGVSQLDTKIAVYLGQGCPMAPALACSDDDCSLQSRASFQTVAGQRYTIQVGLWPAAQTSGAGAIAIELAPQPPANDECWAAAPIAGAGPHPFDTTQCLTGAQGQAEAACLYFNDTAIRNDQWFVWTASVNGTAMLTTCGGMAGSPSEDTKVAVYDGAGCPSSAALACNEDDGVCGVNGYPSTVSWPVACGRQYTIQLGRYPLETNSVLGTFTIAESGLPCVVATPYCFGDGSGTSCPCGNTGLAGRGCGNSVDATGARLDAYGVASLAADSLSLRATGLPNSACLYFQGDARVAGGAGTVFGDGLRCAGGQVLRLGTRTASGGSSSYAPPSDPPVSLQGAVQAPGLRTYQAWYRNSSMYCTPATFNLTSALELVWTP